MNVFLSTMLLHKAKIVRRHFGASRRLAPRGGYSCFTNGGAHGRHCEVAAVSTATVF